MIIFSLAVETQDCLSSNSGKPRNRRVWIATTGSYDKSSNINLGLYIYGSVDQHFEAPISEKSL